MKDDELEVARSSPGSLPCISTSSCDAEMFDGLGTGISGADRRKGGS